MMFSNACLCIYLLNHKEKIVFIPTHSNDPFVFKGGFSYNYLSKLSFVMAQKLFSFFPGNDVLDDIKTFVHPLARTCVQTSIDQLHKKYNSQNINGVFLPQETKHINANTVEVLGALKFFIHEHCAKHKKSVCSLNFSVEQSTCWIQKISWEVVSPK